MFDISRQYHLPDTLNEGSLNRLSQAGSYQSGNLYGLDQRTKKKADFLVKSNQVQASLHFNLDAFGAARRGKMLCHFAGMQVATEALG
jgi:hypothetical protein